MQITNKILSIPPFISTSWNHVHSILMKDDLLLITLDSDNTISIPNLNPAEVAQIFTIHASIMEQQLEQQQLMVSPIQIQSVPMDNRVDIPFRIGIGAVDEFGSSVFQHNPAQADIPEIPLEILNKIITITKLVSPDSFQAIPPAESNCHCVHCQLSRAFHQVELGASTVVHEPEGEISDQELSFQQWAIAQTGDQLYTVTNKLDSHECYNVFLGNPVGCTCGKSNCEHIVAVLKS